MTYNGSKLKVIHIQIFSPAAASFWTHFRRHRAVFERLCGAGGVERVHAPRESAYFAHCGWRVHRGDIRTGWQKFETSTNSDYRKANVYFYRVGSAPKKQRY